MRVLMTTMQLDIGGAETHIVELSKALAKCGIEITVASNGGAYVKELAEAGIEHIKIPFHSKNPKCMINAYKALKKLIFEKKFDVVHAHARIPAFLCHLLQRRYHFRFVTTAHWVFNTRFPYNLLTHWGQRSLAVSDDIKAYLTDNYGIEPDNIRVTINGINFEKFSADTDYSDVAKEFSFADNVKRIIYVSRMDEDRSLAAHKLIEAAPELAEKIGNLEIVIVGGGNDFEPIKAEAEMANQKIGKRVIITTGSRTDINKFTAAGDIFIGVSRAALEAMACGKPSIIAGNEGYIGIFDEDKLKVSIDTNFCCRGCAPTETERLKADILTLLTADEEERVCLGKYARNTVAKYYSMSTMANDAIKMYVSCIKHSKINEVCDAEFDTIDEYLINNPLRTRTKASDILISGYYGFGNSGDDSILYAIIRELKQKQPNVRIATLSKTPSVTAEIYGIDAINRFNVISVLYRLSRTKLLISGGGSLIQDVTSTKSLAYYLAIINAAKLMGKKVMLYANGIGPVKNHANFSKVKSTLNRVDLITLREPSSFEELKKFGVDKPRTVVTADPAFNLFSASEKETEERLGRIGIEKGKKYFAAAIRPWKTADSDFCDAVAAAADYAYEKYGLECVFIQMQPTRDKAITAACAAQMKTKAHIAESSLSPDFMLGIIGGAEFVLGMRLHTLIYAAKCGTPVIGISYDPKIDSIMKYMNQEYRVSAEKPNPITICAYIDKIMQNRDKISTDLSVVSTDSAELAAQNAEMALELIADKTDFNKI